jgi:catechol 2,3-dioxygenase-like lactoylglutathione lyase family enzyme
VSESTTVQATGQPAEYAVPKGEFPKTARERGKIAPIRFAHVVLRTSKNFDKMVWWYKTVLEAVPVFEDQNLCFMAYDEEHHRLGIVRVPATLKAPKFVTGQDHIAYTYADIGELIFTYKRLKSCGVEPYWRINHGPTTSLYYQDPDGNNIELQIDNYKDADEVAAITDSGGFSENPIGEDIDFDDLARRYEAGESFESLRQFQKRSQRSTADVPAAHLGRLHTFLTRLARLLGKA